MAPVMRVSDDGPWTVQDPEVDGAMVTLRPGQPFPADHPVVRTYPWAFVSDVEQVTAAPGERRAAKIR